MSSPARLALAATTIAGAALPMAAEVTAPNVSAANWLTETWFVVPGEEPFRVKGFDRPVAGYWDGAAKRIVLLEWVPSASHLARHEILHALLRRPGHPREYFVDKCGDLVIGPGVPLTID